MKQPFDFNPATVTGILLFYQFNRGITGPNQRTHTHPHPAETIPPPLAHEGDGALPGTNARDGASGAKHSCHSTLSGQCHPASDLSAHSLHWVSLFFVLALVISLLYNGRPQKNRCSPIIFLGNSGLNHICKRCFVHHFLRLLRSANQIIKY